VRVLPRLVCLRRSGRRPVILRLLGLRLLGLRLLGLRLLGLRPVTL
jgi:hypothetical protein